MKKTTAMTLAAAAFLLTTTAAYAADEMGCIADRERAAGKYAFCQSKAKVTSLADILSKYGPAFASCRIKYDATWEKLKTKYPGTTCDTATRFVDNGDSTVSDHLTGLVWEKKDGAGGGANPSDRHDVDNTYTWTNGDADDTDGDGTAFTDFLANLNSGGGFAGTNDWRLPTIQELQTILLAETYPCATSPCTVPELGADAASLYWSSSPGTWSPQFAWYVYTDNGNVGAKISNPSNYFVRGVRGGS